MTRTTQGSYETTYLHLATDPHEESGLLIAMTIATIHCLVDVIGITIENKFYGNATMSNHSSNLLSRWEIDSETCIYA